MIPASRGPGLRSGRRGRYRDSVARFRARIHAGVVRLGGAGVKLGEREDAVASLRPRWRAWGRPSKSAANARNFFGRLTKLERFSIILGYNRERRSSFGIRLS